MQAAKKRMLRQLSTLSALENCGNQGRFLMTRESVILYLADERGEGVEFCTCFIPQESFGRGPSANHYKVLEGQNSEHSVWISQGQILPDQLDYLQQDD